MGIGTIQDVHKEVVQDKVTLEDAVAWKRVRYLMTFLITLSTTTAFAMRVTLSIAIVAMTNNSTNPDFETFNWDSATQGNTLSSFFWGYVVTNIPAGVLVTRYGCRWILLAAMMICSIATVLIPVVSLAGGWVALCALRVVQGASQGAVFPSLNALMAKWAPPNERARLSSICFAGMQLGSIISLPVSGSLAAGSGGWPSIFYMFAGLGFAWCLLWFALGYDTPSDHPYITKIEKDFIESQYEKQNGPATLYTPWWSIIKSLPMWAVLVAHAVQCWGFYVILTEMPTFMNNILKFDIKDNGALMSLPYITMFCLIFFNGWLNDLLLRRQILSKKNARRMFNCIGFLGPMCTMIGLSFMSIDLKELAVVLMVLSTALNSTAYVGFQVNHIDLSPNYAGTLLGITNGLGNIVSMCVPIVVGAVVTEENNVEQWYIIFYITAGAYLFGAVFYTLFSKFEIAPWNERRIKDKSSIETG